jgi:hypothetical protein
VPLSPPENPIRPGLCRKPPLPSFPRKGLLQTRCNTWPAASVMLGMPAGRLPMQKRGTEGGEDDGRLTMCYCGTTIPSLCCGCPDSDAGRPARNGRFGEEDDEDTLLDRTRGCSQTPTAHDAQAGRWVSSLRRINAKSRYSRGRTTTAWNAGVNIPRNFDSSFSRPSGSCGPDYRRTTRRFLRVSAPL